jgi:hypothetical protein
MKFLLFCIVLVGAGAKNKTMKTFSTITLKNSYKGDEHCRGGIIFCQELYIDMELIKDDPDMPVKKSPQCSLYFCIKRGCTHKQIKALKDKDIAKLKTACSCSQLCFRAVLFSIFVMYLY